MYFQSETTKKIAPAFEPNPFPEPRTIPTGWDMSNYLDEGEEVNFSGEAKLPLPTEPAP
jgi:hypothetical protein